MLWDKIKQDMFMNADWYYGERGWFVNDKGGCALCYGDPPIERSTMDLDWQMQMLWFGNCALHFCWIFPELFNFIYMIHFALLDFGFEQKFAPKEFD